ncbi:MAG: hypothetical protein D6785_04160, partial [Planctomycetota bacterium]
MFRKNYKKRIFRILGKEALIYIFLFHLGMFSPNLLGHSLLLEKQPQGLYPRMSFFLQKNKTPLLSSLPYWQSKTFEEAHKNWKKDYFLFRKYYFFQKEPSLAWEKRKYEMDFQDFLFQFWKEEPHSLTWQQWQKDYLEGCLSEKMHSPSRPIWYVKLLKFYLYFTKQEYLRAKEILQSPELGENQEFIQYYQLTIELALNETLPSKKREEKIRFLLKKLSSKWIHTGELYLSYIKMLVSLGKWKQAWTWVYQGFRQIPNQNLRRFLLLYYLRKIYPFLSKGEKNRLPKELRILSQIYYCLEILERDPKNYKLSFSQQKKLQHLPKPWREIGLYFLGRYYWIKSDLHHAFQDYIKIIQYLNPLLSAGSKPIFEPEIYFILGRTFGELGNLPSFGDSPIFYRFLARKYFSLLLDFCPYSHLVSNGLTELYFNYQAEGDLRPLLPFVAKLFSSPFNIKEEAFEWILDRILQKHPIAIESMMNPVFFPYLRKKGLIAQILKLLPWQKWPLSLCFDWLHQKEREYGLFLPYAQKWKKKDIHLANFLFHQWKSHWSQKEKPTFQETYFLAKMALILKKKEEFNGFFSHLDAKTWLKKIAKLWLESEAYGAEGKWKEAFFQYMSIAALQSLFKKEARNRALIIGIHQRFLALVYPWLQDEKNWIDRAYWMDVHLSPQELEKLLERDAKSPILLYTLGVRYFRESKYSKGLQFFHRFLSLPDLPETYYQFGKIKIYYLKRLARLEELSSFAKNESTRIQALLKMAEILESNTLLYYNRLLWKQGRARVAGTYFLHAPPSFRQEITQYMKEHNTLERAMELYKSLWENYPHAKVAPYALYRGWKILKRLSNFNNYYRKQKRFSQKAYEIQKRLETLYPRSKWAIELQKEGEKKKRKEK